MAVVYHEIYLPIDTESTFDYIVIKQGDAGTHKVRATLISNNRVYTIPTSGASYFMKFRKPDNNYCLVEATVSDNTISAEVTEEMLRVSGTGRGEFMIVSGSNELKTATFHVKIVKETYTSEDVQSHSDFAPFAVLLQGAGAAASNANTAAAAANAAASLAERKAQAIPDDYSDLVAEVEEVKADLDADDIIIDRLNGAKNLIGRKQILLYNITNTEIASLYDSQLLPGHSYRFKLSKTNWEYTTPPSGQTLFSITAILIGDDYSDISSLIYKANIGDTVDSEITFETPDNFKYLTLQVRCSKTEKIMITVDDLGSVHPDSGLSYNAKKALIDCFKNVYWQNEDGEKYYKKLMKELNYYEYIYNLESPLSVNGTDGYLVTDAKPLSKAASFTLLIDYTEGGRDWTVSEKVADTILQIADLDNASSKIIVNTFKTANAAYATTRVKLYNVEYSVRESKDDCGSRRIKIGLSYDTDTDLVICAIAINGTVIEPYTDQTASEVGFSPAQQELVIGCSARLAEPLKGIINELSFIAQKFDIDELTEYVTN